MTVVYTRLLEALGAKVTPRRLRLLRDNLSRGEAAFLADAATRFESLFGRQVLSVLVDLQSAGEYDTMEEAAEAVRLQLGTTPRPVLVDRDGTWLVTTSVAEA